MKPPSDPADRDLVLERQRLRKMARSAHAFVRGSTRLFYTWLEELTPELSIPEGPPVWICGDCHLGNLGPLADAEGRVDIQIRDLDQAVVGNPAHDLIRLALSLASAARSSDLPGVATAHIVEAMVEGYGRGLVNLANDESVRESAIIAAVKRRALGRKWRHLADERIDGPGPVIPRGKRFWSISDEEGSDLERAISTEAARALILALGCRGSEDAVALVDAAYWVKGCSSLGTARYAALVRVGSRKEGQFALLDFKEAVEPIPPVTKSKRTPANPAERVVAGACALSPNLGERMQPVSICGRPMVMRELRPQDLKIELDQFSRPEAVRAAGFLASVIGRSHGRQLDQQAREAWQEQVSLPSLGSLEAPPWLWRSVVALSGRHEAAYLEHCRRYALSAAH